MARPRSKRRAAALAKLAAFRDAHPQEPVPPSLLTYFDESGLRRYTISGHDTRKSSLHAAERYASFSQRARRNETRLRLALDVANMICFDWDILEDQVRRLDPQKLEYSEPVGPFDHLGAVIEAVHSDDREKFRADIEEALADPEGRFKTEIRVRNPDGSTSWYSERGRVERDPQGRPLRLIGVAIDVTAQKLAGKAS